MHGYFDLDGRVALVTGASRGLGLAMAEALAEAGATVILNGRHANTLKDAADGIRDRRFNAETSVFDVTDHDAADAAIQSIVARHHRIDILIANAGVTHRAQLADWTSEAWDAVLEANLKACFFLAQSAAAPMRSQGRGRIIFTTSALGILGRFTPTQPRKADSPASPVLLRLNWASMESLAMPSHPVISRPNLQPPS